jgi:hypothetical protein
MHAFVEVEEVSPLKAWGVALPALWLAPESGRLNALETALLPNIFPGYRCYVWSVSDGGGASPAIKQIKRAFGEWPVLRKSVVAKDESIIGGRLFYCDVAAVEPEYGASIAELASRTLWGKCSGLFMSDNPVTGFPDDLLSLCRIGIEHSGKDMRSERELLLRRYLASAAASGTIPLLVVEDSNTRQFLVAPSHDRVPKDVVVTIATRGEFEAWLTVGVDLRILT